jgi:tetratricopeptide (TPR) repeat protein
MSFVRVLCALYFVIAAAAAAQETSPDPTTAGPDATEVKRLTDIQNELREMESQAESRRDDPEFFFQLGNLYMDLSQRIEAENAYKAALSLDPDYLEALVNYGSLKNEAGDLDGAIELLVHAVEVSPNEPKAYVNLGNAYYSKGEYYSAMQQYRAAKEVDAESFEADYQIGVAFADAGIYREAINSWERVVELAPGTEAATAASQNIAVVEKILARRQ